MDPEPTGGVIDRARATIATATSQARSKLAPVWANPKIGMLIAAAVSALWGLVAGRWTPRGPLTTAQALWSIVISLAIGAAAGFVWRSRWAMLVAPVAFAIAVELARAGIDGPTVDGPETSAYGLLAMVVGRGIHGLLSLFPLILGASLGAAGARRLQTEAARNQRRLWVHVRRAGATLATIALLALMVGLARPARTAAIVDADGNRVPGSVAELTTIDVDGHELDLLIRGHSTDNPVLLFLAGGPGGSEMGAMRNHLPELEEHVTVVTWDQRGTGKSYDQLDPTSTVSLQGYVDDTLVVTDHLRERFGQDEIYLMGQSWGTLLGVLAVAQHPDRYAAYIGVGQMVDVLETDTIFYEDTLAWAEETGKGGLVDDLEAIGPPPYDRMLDYETALSYEHEIYPYDHSANHEGEGGFSENFIVEEYSLIEQVHLLGGFMDTFAALYPQLQDLDLRATATDLEVPVYFVQGAHEAEGRAEVFDDWYPMVDAPSKDLVVLSTSGHRPLWEQPDEFVDYISATVLPETTGSS